MKYKTFSIIIFTSLASTCFSQDNICEQRTAGVFWPIKIATKAQYYSQAALFTSYFNGDSIQFNGNTFYKEIKEYVNGRVDTNYFREQNGNIFIYDPKRSVEFLELSNNITPGYTWEKYDKSWTYII